MTSGVVSKCKTKAKCKTMRNKTRTHQRGDTTGRTEQRTGRNRRRWKNMKQRWSNIDKGRGRQNELTKTRGRTTTQKDNTHKGKILTVSPKGQLLDVQTKPGGWWGSAGVPKSGPGEILGKAGTIGRLTAKVGTLWRSAAKAGPSTDWLEYDCARPNQGTGTGVGWTTNRACERTRVWSGAYEI